MGGPKRRRERRIADVGRARRRWPSWRSRECSSRCGRRSTTRTSRSCWCSSIVAAASFGGRAAGVTTSVVAALAFNFFHTQPYYSLRISDRFDIITTVLLVVVGLAVGEIAVLSHRHEVVADEHATGAAASRTGCRRWWRVAPASRMSGTPSRTGSSRRWARFLPLRSGDGAEPPAADRARRTLARRREVLHGRRLRVPELRASRSSSSAMARRSAGSCSSRRVAVRCRVISGGSGSLWRTSSPSWSGRGGAASAGLRLAPTDPMIGIPNSHGEER